MWTASPTPSTGLPHAAAAGLGEINRLPFSLKVLLENLLRHEDGSSVSADEIRALAGWIALRRSATEIAYRPARVLMQDFTGVPGVVDLAAMRAAMTVLGGEPARINPLAPVDLVIDHSVQVDAFGGPDAFKTNVDIEMARNAERYAFLRWGQQAFENFRVVPPGTGICHQVNLEYLAQVVWTREADGATLAYPDTLVGTDSHTTMVNGLAVLGWGVGGIEAEAAMLGQPISMLIPRGGGLQADRAHGRGRDGNRPRAHGRPNAPRPRRGRQVRRILRPRTRLALPGRPRHARQHGARIRRDLRLLSDRRGNHPLSRIHRPRARPGRPRRGLREGAGDVARRRDRRSAVHRQSRARHLIRRAQPCGDRNGRRTGLRFPARPPPSTA